MFNLKPTNKKPIEVKKIVFNNSSPIDYPKNVRVPNIGEYIWFSVFNQGIVVSIENRLEYGFFVTTIYVKELK